MQNKNKQKEEQSINILNKAGKNPQKQFTFLSHVVCQIFTLQGISLAITVLSSEPPRVLNNI